ncbi:MAG: cation diffusion facilitator family transporter [Dongiaceae bacterium]
MTDMRLASGSAGTSATTDDDIVAGRLMRRATYASLATALTLVTIKTIAALMTGSVSILSTLLDSLLDTAASVVTLFAVRHALVPADREHRFGHGKVEALAALAQSAFITGSAVFLMVEVIGRFSAPVPVTHSAIGIGVMLISIAATIALVFYQRHVIRKTRSLAIRSDSAHYIGDLAVNVAVIVAVLVTTQLGWLYADPVIATAIAAYIVWMAWGVARGALDMLMDRELPDVERQTIKSLALADPRVCAVHDLRTRSAGRQHFIQMHIEMDGRLSLTQAHEIADAAEGRILEAFPGSEVIVHQDPDDIVEAPPSFA